MSRAHQDTGGAELQVETDRGGWNLYFAGLALAMLAGLIIGFAVGRFL